ncbi:MAG: hypothetical protein ACRENN_02925 [Candidatus Eiseniibacteriota bacterium]
MRPRALPWLAVTMLGAAVLAGAGPAAAGSGSSGAATQPTITTRPKPTTPAPSRSGPLAPKPDAPVELQDNPWNDRVGAYHGDRNGLAWGGEGELRFAEDRVRGVTDPEWFSVGRVGGFVSLRVSKRIELLGDGAWDQGTNDFSMEELEARLLVGTRLQLHGGIFLVPLGRSNLSHEAPVYEFAERSLPATQIVGVPNPQAGLGVRGKMGRIGKWPLSWEADAVTGYDDGLVMDAVGGTRVPAGRNNYGDNNGVPAAVGRLALHPSLSSEIGFAAQSGRYNKTVLGGVTVDNPRYVHVLVADYTGTWAGFGLFSEGAMAIIDVPPGLGTIFAERQWGASLEITRRLLEPVKANWYRTKLSAGLRLDGVDLDRAIEGDSRIRASASLNFHRVPIGVVRLGWYYEMSRDRFNNETPKAGVTVTTAAYF